MDVVPSGEALSLVHHSRTPSIACEVKFLDRPQAIDMHAHAGSQTAGCQELQRCDSIGRAGRGQRGVQATSAWPWSRS